MYHTHSISSLSQQGFTVNQTSSELELDVRWSMSRGWLGDNAALTRDDGDGPGIDGDGGHVR